MKRYQLSKINHLQFGLQPQLQTIHNHTHINLSTLDAIDYFMIYLF